MSEKKPSLGLRIYAVLAFIYLYLPILILIIFSFNTQKINVRWQGFTLDWYKVLVNDQNVILATRNTLIIATVSTIIATIIGTMAALALQRYRFPGHDVAESGLYIPVIIPEVVMGISLLAFFASIGLTLGLVSITLSHIAFSIPFVTLVVRARLHGFDKSIEEAAMDLGANEVTTFWRVTLPTIMPGVLSGALLAFTLSLDDYVITYFTAGPGSTTLPLRIFSMVRFSVTPEVNALSTLWVLTIFVVLLIGQIAQRRQTTG
ncbi:MAG: spermidine/putrescine ABC transporter permease [Chloroflexi bacterium RBG_16_57_11]|nr:MAG: spermidine/putrescine ABC transporter permease [Chloroflexi bacterium RBG_16_57_11]